MKRRSLFLAVGIPVLLILIGLILSFLPSDAVPVNAKNEVAATKKSANSPHKDAVTIEHTDYAAPKDDDDLLADDRIQDKHTVFDPALIDRRFVDGWKINSSEAVIRLDVPIIKPDVDPELLTLHPSYKAAAGDRKLLPSVNMIDGKAKQFDDGLYAALDQAYFAGNGSTLRSHVDLLRAIFDRVDKNSEAAIYLAAGLELAGVQVQTGSPAAVKSLVTEFLGIETQSKPIGFYTWTPELSKCFRFLRYFSAPIRTPQIVTQLAAVLRQDAGISTDYRKALGFYSRLSNPMAVQSLAAFADNPDRKIVADDVVAVFPPSSSRETELFNKLLPSGRLSPDFSLMRELITAIRSGRVNLAPTKGSGWYDYQVYALETLLIPEKGDENNKLLLTKSYKKRMLEAFKALVTKRRETHLRQMVAPSEAPNEVRQKLDHVAPRLRVEPCPSFYLRTARSYAFLSNFLESSVGEPSLSKLHGLRENGQRELALSAELHQMRDLFYGLYFLSCEDIGKKLALLDAEPVDQKKCEKIAENWLGSWSQDADLAADTRIAIPVYHDRVNKKTRLWMTIGVRLAKLDASYEIAPKVRPVNDSGDWTSATSEQLQMSSYFIAVDEFAEVEIDGLRVLSREELRAVCDAKKTKAAILEALRK